jgi:alcohol dehydrogenase
VSARTVAGAGSIEHLGHLAGELGFRRTLLVADPGLPFIDEVELRLKGHGLSVAVFRNFSANPDTVAIASGRDAASAAKVDSIVALGGGSALDCAKGINFLLTNGGEIRDYLGYGRALKPMLPMIGIPTTSGTGSEAQSFALISDAATHTKMACGDPKAAFALVILDPALTGTAPRYVRAAAGFDAIAHAVETYVTRRRSSLSLTFSREAWRLLSTNYETSLEANDISTLEAMQTGAYLAGLAIENSMLGAAHACSNPLTKNYGTTHGHALAILVPHVVRWNHCSEYSELHQDLAGHLRALADAGELPRSLRDAGVPESDLPQLAAEAAEQWTGRFNPRAFDKQAALEIYRCAY